MGYLSEKVAYLKGLCDGLELDGTTKEGKILSAIVEVLDEIAVEVDDMVIIQDDMQEQLDDVDEDLASLEDDFYELDDELDDDFDDEDWDDMEDEELEEEYSFECPKCGDLIYFDPNLLDEDVESIVCPNCKEKIVLEFDSEEE